MGIVTNDYILSPLCVTKLIVRARCLLTINVTENIEVSFGPIGATDPRRGAAVVSVNMDRNDFVEAFNMLDGAPDGPERDAARASAEGICDFADYDAGGDALLIRDPSIANIGIRGVYFRNGDVARPGVPVEGAASPQPTHFPNIPALIGYASQTDGNISRGVLSKDIFRIENRHTKTGGHAADLADYPDLFQNAYELSDGESVKNFADGLWYIGHVISTKASTSQVYGADSLNLDIPPLNAPSRSAFTIDCDLPNRDLLPPTLTQYMIIRIKAMPSGSSVIDLAKAIMQKLRLTPGGCAIRWPTEFAELAVKAAFCSDDDNEY